MLTCSQEVVAGTGFLPYQAVDGQRLQAYLSGPGNLVLDEAAGEALSFSWKLCVEYGLGL